MFDIAVFAINYLLTMVSILFIVLFTQLIFDIRFKLKSFVFYIMFVGFICSVAVYFVNYLGMRIESILLFLITFVISTVVLLKVTFKMRFSQCAISAGIFAIILGSGFALSYYIQYVFKTEGEYLRESFWRLIFAHVIINTVNITVYIIIKSYKMITKFPKEIKTKAYITNTFYVLLAGIVETCNFWYFYRSHAREIDGVIFIFNTVLLMFFYIFSVLNTNTFFDLESKSQELKYQVFYNMTLDKLMNDLRVFKHNYDNMLASIKSYIEARQIDELEVFVNESIGKKNKIDILSNFMLLNIRSAGILGIITSKLEYANQMGINMKIIVQDEIKEINMKISDLCEILGILLDNAIEAAKESEGKYVRLNIKKSEEIISFCIENAIKEKPVLGKIFERGFSTKGQGRGLGLWILNNITNKYSNVLLNTFVGEKEFRQEINIS